MASNLVDLDSTTFTRGNGDIIQFTLLSYQNISPKVDFNAAIQTCLDRNEVLTSFESLAELQELNQLVFSQVDNLLQLSGANNFAGVFIGGTHREGIDLNVDLSRNNFNDYIFIDDSVEGLQVIAERNNWFRRQLPFDENDRCLTVSTDEDFADTGLNELSCDENVNSGFICSKLILTPTTNPSQNPTQNPTKQPTPSPTDSPSRVEEEEDEEEQETEQPTQSPTVVEDDQAVEEDDDESLDIVPLVFVIVFLIGFLTTLGLYFRLKWRIKALNEGQLGLETVNSFKIQYSFDDFK